MKRKLGGQDWDGEELLSTFSGGAKRERPDVSRLKQGFKCSENTSRVDSAFEVRSGMKSTKIYGRRMAFGFC